MNDSIQVWDGQGFVVWFTEGDNRQYWVSDASGYELETFDTKQEAINWITKGGSR